MGQRERQIQENPSELFTIATNSMFAFAFVIYIHITWFKRDGLANLYNVCHNNDHFRVPKRTKANSVVYKETALVLIGTLIMAYLAIFGVTGDQYVVVLDQFAQAIEDAIFGTEAQVNKFISGLIYFSVAIQFCYMSIFSHFVVIIFPDMACLAIFDIGKNCAKFLKENPDLEFHQIRTYIRNVQSLVSNINSIVQFQILLFVSNAGVNLTIALLDVLDPVDTQIRISSSVYSTAFIVMILLTANSASQMEKLSDYIYDRRDRPGYRENADVLVLLSDLETNPIALKSFKFPVTYGFIVTVKLFFMKLELNFCEFYICMCVFCFQGAFNISDIFRYPAPV
ncbi:uncharacterized protein LOC118434616 isoform X1 [Folsomia candida]|uniref:uncharacterized protein LOC118434616 isoform X1 n=1 Tax=Folsomia candida TaxID=158441 RepID=UPI0016051F32|nr:uncharacterized protein LOC118434616 isoform X1 [Folsomia candida]